eukprot:CAMPEP_0198204154 /NCGR_PEP_ID=MMETSP1445-20131203/7536_1 /TAXON_ID=36898 /ORGANISM="Pyramimonas sp., Strain CCMP2087" /LENGTH=710 /DNA_ID=CAMNT_0043875895 /DNA_START=44 /DNA_END=2176 /DNA_ORIENTATION=-
MVRSRHALVGMLVLAAFVPFVLIPNTRDIHTRPAFAQLPTRAVEAPLADNSIDVTRDTNLTDVNSHARTDDELVRIVPDATAQDSDDSHSSMSMDDSDDSHSSKSMEELLPHAELTSVAVHSESTEASIHLRWRWSSLGDLFSSSTPPPTVPTVKVEVTVHEPVTEPWWLESPPLRSRQSQGSKLWPLEVKQPCNVAGDLCRDSSFCKRGRVQTVRCERKCNKDSPFFYKMRGTEECQNCLKLQVVGECGELVVQCRQAQAACLQAKIRSGLGHLKWFSMWDENHYVPDEFIGWANFGFTANITNITEGARLGMRHLYKATPVFWERTTTHHSPLRLRADYLEQWELMWPTLKELYTNGSIVGFVLGDELLWMGLDWASIETAANLIRHDFPGSIIWMNEASGVVGSGCNHFHVCTNWTHVPAAINWFSLDRYWTTSRHTDHAARLRENYEKHLIPKLNRNQSIVLVPGAFASAYNKKCKKDCYDGFCSNDAKEYVEWALEDGRIAAIIPYHWHYCRGCRTTRNEVGVQGMNATRAMWRMIGRNIVEQSNTMRIDVPAEEVAGRSEDAWLFNFDHASHSKPSKRTPFKIQEIPILGSLYTSDRPNAFPSNTSPKTVTDSRPRMPLSPSGNPALAHLQSLRPFVKPVFRSHKLPLAGKHPRPMNLGFPQNPRANPRPAMTVAASSPPTPAAQIPSMPVDGDATVQTTTHHK